MINDELIRAAEKRDECLENLYQSLLVENIFAQYYLILKCGRLAREAMRQKTERSE